MAMAGDAPAGWEGRRMQTIDDEDRAKVGSATAAGAAKWKVLIVDDAPAVHQAAVAALAETPVHDRALQFVHAGDAAQAIALLREQSDFAVILLKVGGGSAAEGGENGASHVIDGLALARTIRNDLGRNELRIVLLGDGAADAPPVEVFRDCDINDFKTRAELTRGGLYATLTSAVRGYAQMRAFNVGRRGLDQIIEASGRMLARPRLRDFAAAIIGEVANLLAQKPEGLVCARDPASEGEAVGGGELRIIAAAGRFAPFLDQPLTALGNPALAALLKQSLADRHNLIGEQACALYFAGESGNDLTAYIDTGQALDEINRRLLEVFVANIASNLNNVELFERLHAQAYQDALLHIPNRLAFMRAVGDALAERAPTATVAIVDIDHFSHLNDALGYRYGDTLLRAVAQRLNERLPVGTFVARLSGDTFGVLGDGQEITPQTLLPLFVDAFSAEGAEQRLSATIGLVRLSEVDGNASDVIKSANIALNLAKHHRRGEGVYFIRRMEFETRARMRLLRALRTAFDQRWLQVDYQPQVCLKTQRLTGCEALLRWRNEEGQGVPPGQFIALAESSGLIVALGKWVLRTACNDLQRLLAAQSDKARTPELGVSVNVSVVQFRHPGFLDTVDEVLGESGIDPRRLELEITESVAMLDASYMQGTINRIKKRGIAIAIDDFGTGFSSLSYLERLDVDRLKIDQSFVSQMMLSDSSLRIVETVVQLGRSLQLEVIAEGVEDEEQAEVLRRIGCDSGQGYLFGRPMALAKLAELLAATSAASAQADAVPYAAVRSGEHAQASPR